MIVAVRGSDRKAAVHIRPLTTIGSPIRIRDIETHIVDVELPRPFHMASRSMTRQTEIVVRVITDEGVTGTGIAHGSPLDGIAAMIRHRFGSLLIGTNPLDIERAWQTMFATTCEPMRPSAGTTGASLPKAAGQPQAMAAIAGIDIALWDIAGQAYGQPVWRLLGGATDRVRAYATGGYYRDEDEAAGLTGEFAGYADQGFRAVKLKAGGRSPDVDVERAATVRAAIGDDVELYVDGTRGWSVRDAIRAGRGFEELGVTWYEEPLAWYDDVSGLAQVARQVRIPLTSGESEYTKQGVRDLILHGHVSVLNFDCSKAGGLTEGRKIAALAEVHNVLLSPHHAAHVHVHLVAGVANGLSVELHPDPERDPLWDQMFERRPELSNGEFVLDETPGLGFVIDPAWFEANAVEVT